MKTLYLDCSMGAAGDMLTAALIELHPDPQHVINTLNTMHLADTHAHIDRLTKKGVTGTHFAVHVHGTEEHSHDLPGHTHDHTHKEPKEYGDKEHMHAEDCAHHHDGQPPAHHHHHANMHYIEHTVEALQLPEPVKKDVIGVYGLIAEAESRAHNTTVSQVHFHEVGSKDAVMDIAAFSLLINELAPEQIVATPICTGYGHVHCAHGILPVPAPATAYLLEGLPNYAGKIEGELCTPTGAALLRHFANKFETMPSFDGKQIGYGMGMKEFEKVNCVKAVII